MEPSAQTPPEKRPNEAVLDYAQRPRLAWVGRHKRLLILLALCIAVAGPIWWNWKPLKHRILWLYWSRQAAAHVMPPGVELILTDPQRAAKLIASNPDYVANPVWVSTTQPAAPGAYYIPESFRQLSLIDPRMNIVHYESTVPRAGPIVFMGTLRRPDGVRRLVIVTCPAKFPWNMASRPRVLVFPLAGLFDPVPLGTYAPVTLVATGSGGIQQAVEPRSVATDQSNLSHIVIRYDIIEFSIFRVTSRRSEQRKLDAYLQDDDSVKLVFNKPLEEQLPDEPLEFRVEGDPAKLRSKR